MAEAAMYESQNWTDLKLTSNSIVWFERKQYLEPYTEISMIPILII